MAQGEGLSNAEDYINMLEELALERMDTESQPVQTVLMCRSTVAGGEHAIVSQAG